MQRRPCSLCSADCPRLNVHGRYDVVGASLSAGAAVCFEILQAAMTAPIPQTCPLPNARAAE
jgi:hypothetical protein